MFWKYKAYGYINYLKGKDIKKILISQIGNNHQILTTDNPITGLSLYNTLKPSVLFIDDDLDKINSIVFVKS